MASLNSLTVARLDELAAQHGVSDYPADGLKADKVEALEEALGVDYEAPDDAPTWSVSAADGYNGAQFQAGNQHVELEGDDVYTTSDPNLAAGLRDVPFLKVEED